MHYHCFPVVLSLVLFDIFKGFTILWDYNKTVIENIHHSDLLCDIGAVGGSIKVYQYFLLHVTYTNRIKMVFSFLKVFT